MCLYIKLNAEGIKFNESSSRNYCHTKAKYKKASFLLLTSGCKALVFVSLTTKNTDES